MDIELVEFAQACNRYFVIGDFSAEPERSRIAQSDYQNARNRLVEAGYSPQSLTVDEAFDYVRETGNLYGRPESWPQ